MRIDIQTQSGQKIEPFFYGTAWKEDNTQRLTKLALETGFRAIDTANQRKHYFEEGVGLGISDFLYSDTCNRKDLFIQTKFTFRQGQDHRLPYDQNSPLEEQVRQSYKSSIQHLKTDYIDSYILHGPYYSDDISQEDLLVWQAMEQLVEAGLVRYIGISNVTAPQLDSLTKQVNIQPTFVQNRCFASTGWDMKVRTLCNELSIIYQGFSLLTANIGYLQKPEIIALTKKYNQSIPQIVFRFAQQIGMIPLTGSTNAKHMSDDLAINQFDLDASDVGVIETIYV